MDLFKESKEKRKLRIVKPTKTKQTSIFGSSNSERFSMCGVRWVAKVLLLVVVIFVAGPRIHQVLLAALLGDLLFR